MPKRIRIFDGKNLVVEFSVQTLETVQRISICIDPKTF